MNHPIKPPAKWAFVLAYIWLFTILALFIWGIVAIVTGNFPDVAKWLEGITDRQFIILLFALWVIFK